MSHLYGIPHATGFGQSRILDAGIGIKNIGAANGDVKLVTDFITKCKIQRMSCIINIRRCFIKIKINQCNTGETGEAGKYIKLINSVINTDVGFIIRS
jgi:hypothetical protein